MPSQYTHPTQKRVLIRSGWKEQNDIESDSEEKEIVEDNNKEIISVKKSNSTWARLIAKIYEVDPLVCAKCGSEMKVLSVILDSYEINKILKHLVKIGKSPPSLDESVLTED